jgi:hypothetical protein
MSKRAITPNRSIRLGGKIYRSGDEDALLEQIDKESAGKLVERGVLQGNWSGAQGAHQSAQQERLRQRAAKTQVGRTLQALMTESGAGAKKGAKPPPPEEDEEEEEDEEDEDEDEEEPGDIGEDYEPPFTLRAGTGGWYTFVDANGDVLEKDEKPVKIQGKPEAERYLKQLNR